MENIFAEAYKYHTLGRCIIPSGGGYKHKGALVKWESYQHKQSTEAEIEAWQKQYKPPLWAMITGTISNLFTIDCDTLESAAPLTAGGLKPHLKTPRKGYHFYCQLPDFRVKTMVGLFPHVDIRGEGGYSNFVGRTPDGVYKILQHPTDDSLIPFESLPQEWQDRIRAESQAPVTNVQNGQMSEMHKDDGLGERMLKQYVGIAKHGTRNETGLNLACQLRDNRITQEDASPLMLQYANAVRDLPSDDGTHAPYTEKEALESLASAYSRPAREPWPTTLEDIPLDDISSPGQKVKVVHFHYTDLGNAERLVWRFGKILHFCEERNQWLIWNDRVWVWDSGMKVKALAKLVIRQYYAEAASLVADKDKDELLDFARKSEGESRINAMVNLARIEPGITIKADKLDTHPWLLNCLNGTLDLRTGILQPHRKEDLLTYLLPTPYDLVAKCPQFDKFLDRIMDSKAELIRYLQRAVGYSLTGTIREQVLFFLFGAGSNGKTTFTNIIQLLLGNFAKHLDIEVLTYKEYGSGGTSEGLANLNGKRAAFTSETTEGRRLNETTVKNMVGCDPISVSKKYEHEITFLPTHKLWIFGNHKPSIQDSTKGMWRKIKLIPFTVEIPEQERDVDMPEKLATELPGILAWAVRGCLDWQKNGLGEPTEVTDATAGYQAEQDDVGQFIADCCVLGKNEDCTTKELHEAYVEYCNLNGDTALRKRTFGNRIAERGIDRATGTGNVKRWVGIGIKP